MKNEVQETFSINDIYKYLEEESNISIKSLIGKVKYELGLSTDKEVALIMNITPATLSRLINKEKTKIDVLTLIKLSVFLQIRIEELSNIIVADLDAKSIGEIEKSRKARFISKHFDIKTLKSIGFIDSNASFEDIEARVVSFFNFDTIFDYESYKVDSLFSKNSLSGNDKMRNLWVKSAFYQFKKIANPNPFNREQIKSVVTKIKPYTRLERKGLLTVRDALYKIGITIIIQKYVSKTSIKGATFYCE